MRVVHGPHWKWCADDCGYGVLGVATHGEHEDWLKVKWDSGEVAMYSLRSRDRKDIRIFELAPSST